MRNRINRISGLAAAATLVATALLAAGCTTSRPAPVSERAPGASPSAVAAPVSAAPKPFGPSAAPPDARADTYTVKAGDTLYSIALEHGVDYRELAVWNGIDNPSALRVGQQLRVSAPASAAIAAPLKTPGGTVQGKPLAGSAGTAATPLPSPSASGGAPLMTEPKAARAPYSEQALAQLTKPEAPASVRAEAPARPEPAREAPESARGPDEPDWAWPVRGKVIGTFNDSSSKGIAISGRMGQPVHASAPGRVIFSGTGIRGFGKLVVIKHNATYLSVYAHNSELAVKEGQNVAKGQKIAEMGNSDADQVKLHFEIRRFGKPVDPMRLLPGAG